MNQLERESAAREAWGVGDDIRAGELIYERIPPHRRVPWASGLLALFCSRISPPPAVTAVGEIAASEPRWHEAHGAFDAVRLLTLDQERLGVAKDGPLYGLLLLAENVAKVIYNASGHPAPFDHNAGWWLPQNARFLIRQLHDIEFEKLVVDALFAPRREKHLQ